MPPDCFAQAENQTPIRGNSATWLPSNFQPGLSRILVGAHLRSAFLPAELYVVTDSLAYPLTRRHENQESGVGTAGPSVLRNTSINILAS